MNIRSLVFALTALVGVIGANDDVGQLAVALAVNGAQLYGAHEQQKQSLPNAKNNLRRLYWLDKYNPNWLKMADYQKDFEYHIANVIDHIKVLEGKILEKKNYLESAGMKRGVVLSVLSALSVYGARYCYKTRKGMNAVEVMEAQNLMMGCVGLSAMSAMFTAGAANQFYKLSRYAERLVERLERDKRILAILEEAKALKDSSMNNVSDAALQLINSLVGVITNFSQPSQQQPVPIVAIEPVITVPQEDIVYVAEVAAPVAEYEVVVAE